MGEAVVTQLLLLDYLHRRGCILVDITINCCVVALAEYTI